MGTDQISSPPPHLSLSNDTTVFQSLNRHKPYGRKSLASPSLFLSRSNWCQWDKTVGARDFSEYFPLSFSASKSVTLTVSGFTNTFSLLMMSPLLFIACLNMASWDGLCMAYYIPSRKLKGIWGMHILVNMLHACIVSWGRIVLIQWAHCVLLSDKMSLISGEKPNTWKLTLKIKDEL